MKSYSVPSISAESLGNSLFECISIDASNNNEKLLSRESPVVVQMGVVCICLRGSGSIVINEHEYAIGDGTLLTILPNALISSATSSEDFLGYAIAADTKFMMSIQMSDIVRSYVHISTHPVLKINEEHSSRLMEICEILRRYNGDSDHLFASDIARHLLTVLCYQIHAIYIDNAPNFERTTMPHSRQNSLCQEFFSLVERHATKHRDMSFYADALCITPKYLSVVVRKASGRSPVEWIDRTVMLYARTLLSSSDLTVQQISAELNFPNPSFFGQYFKRHEGVTPKQYRTKAS